MALFRTLNYIFGVFRGSVGALQGDRAISDQYPSSDSYTSFEQHRRGPHSADKKFVRARGPQNWNPEVFEQTRCSRILHVEFPQNNRELVKAEVFEKRVFEQTTPFKLRNEGGIFLEQPFGRNCAAAGKGAVSPFSQCKGPCQHLCQQPFLLTPSMAGRRSHRTMEMIPALPS